MASTTVVSQENWHHMGENKLLGEAECQPKLFYSYRDTKEMGSSKTGVL